MKIYASNNELIEINEKVKEAFCKNFVKGYSLNENVKVENIEREIKNFFEEIKVKILEKFKHTLISKENLFFNAYSENEDFVFVLNFKDFKLKKALNIEFFKFGRFFLIESYAKVSEDFLCFFGKNKEIKVNPMISSEKFNNATKLLPWEKENFETIVSTSKPHLNIKKKNQKVDITFFQKIELLDFLAFFNFLKEIKEIKEINISFENQKKLKLKLKENKNIEFVYENRYDSFITFFEGLELFDSLIYRLTNYENFEFIVKDYGKLKIKNGKIDFFVKDNFFSEIIIENSKIIKFESSNFITKKMIEIFADDFKLNGLMAKILIEHLKIKDKFSFKILSENLTPEMFAFFLFVYDLYCQINNKEFYLKNEDMFIINKIREFAPIKDLNFFVGNISFSGFYNKPDCIINLKENPGEPIKFLSDYIKELEKQNIKNIRIFLNSKNIRVYFNGNGYVFQLKSLSNNSKYIEEIKKLFKIKEKKLEIYDFNRKINS